MSTSFNWSDDRVTTLSKLWRDGLSASRIAKALGGVTRNAVIGKIHRLGLSGRGLPPARARLVRPLAPRSSPSVKTSTAEVQQSRPKLRLEAPLLSAPEGPGLIVDQVHLSAHTCKWPIGDPKSPDFTFCGHRSDGRYCMQHERKSVRPGTA
jgi:GcrA cell cycle regulator